MKRHETYWLHGVYSAAAAIEGSMTYQPSLNLIDWEQRENVKALVKPGKHSILKTYIFSVLRDQEGYFFWGSSDLFMDSYESDPIYKGHIPLIEVLTEDFRQYNLPVPPFKPYVDRYANSNEDWFRVWYIDYYSVFVQRWVYLADAIFHVVFANRRFLLTFNTLLGDYLNEDNVAFDEIDLKVTGGGKLKRQRLPKWLKRAIFHRDRGRCVFCGKDLTGLISVEADIHLDHMVPLANWGTNDPVNFQLTCAECNLRKSDKVLDTSNLYEPWWT